LTPRESEPRDVSPGTTILRGVVATTIQLGASIHHVVEIEPKGRILVVRQDRSGEAFESGDQVWVTIESRDCILIHPGDGPGAPETASNARA
jgi:hypothetical protein